MNIKYKNRTAWILSMAYMISYMTRINYGAVVSEMEQAMNMPKSALSVALTGSFITYGFGQVISGICGDKFSPKRLVAGGLLLSSFMNLLLPLCTNQVQMVIVWCINGFAQAFMWPPILKIMAALFVGDEYNDVAVKVSAGSSAGTIIIYLVSPLIISVAGWKQVFYLCAVCGFVMVAVWNKNIECTGISTAAGVNSSDKTKNVFLSPLMILIMLAIILQGMLRDGVTTWMPSYIAETYKLSSAAAILSGVILPVFGILCFKLTAKLYSKKLTNPLVCAATVFGFGFISAVFTSIFSGKNAGISTLLMAMLTGSMHGVNLILISMIPRFFNKTGNVSTVSGILNSCTYIGSAISTYGIAVLTERFGWQFMLAIWCVTAFAGTIVCTACVTPWKKQFEKEEENCL